MGLRQDESDRINDQVDSLLDRTKKLDNPFTLVKNAEKNGTVDNQSNPNTENLKEAEENTTQNRQNDWVNNVSGKDRSDQSKNKGVLKFLKKKGPLTAIISITVGGGFGLSMFFSPGLLLVQIKEMMVSKFNTQLTSMDVRTTLILTKKMGTTSGLCGSVMTIKCKYSTMSEKQLKNFNNAGIKINYGESTVTTETIHPDGTKTTNVEVKPAGYGDTSGKVVTDTLDGGKTTVTTDVVNNKTFLGRAKPTSFEFKNKTIAASEFYKLIKESPEFRVALNKGYNPKFGGFSDSTWKKAANYLGISKLPAPIDGETDEARLKKIQQETKSPSRNIEGVDPNIKEGATPEEIEKANNAANNANEIAGGASEIVQSGEKVGDDVLEIAEAGAAAGLDKSLSLISNTFKLTGALDSACTAYGAVQAVGYAAKTVRALQLARYAMIFLNVADQIKAGTAKPDDVSYLGKILTSTSNNGKSATDSFGYKYAAFGDKGPMPTTASQFLAGGGLTGSLIGVNAKIVDAVGANPKRICGVLRNPFVSAASLIGGIALMFVPGVNVPLGLKAAGQAAIAIAFEFAIAALPGMLKDIVAGVLVDKNTIGELAGDAITSGASGMMGTVAKAGGNAPLTPEQAVAYNNLSSDIAARHAEEDRLTYSPFDATNRNTFVGSIVSSLIPYVSKMSSISSTLSSIVSISLNSFSFLSPQAAKAVSISDYTTCQDFDYRELNLATDPYCNVMYGIPVENLNTDPIDVATSMAGQIDEVTGNPIDGSEYSEFLETCINRTDPLGDTTNGTDGSECILNGSVNSKYTNYYLYYIDQRIENGMEEGLSETTADNGSTGGSTDPGDSSQPADTDSKNNGGWTIRDNVDYSNVSCAAGSTDEGTYKHPTEGFTIRKCKTPIGIVASIISGRTLNIATALKNAGYDLTKSGAFRTYESQLALREKNCSDPINSPSSSCNPPTAKPGQSMHEKGLAIDFSTDKGTLRSSDPEFNWLKQNGASYGFINLPSESWHWSMSGG